MTDAERERIMAESRATRDLPNGQVNDEQPSPMHAQPPVFEDALAKWKREAVDFEQKRAAERARRRRQERQATAASAQMDAATAQAWERWVDQRIAAALAEHNQKFDELARGSVEFSDAVCARLRQMETMLEQLSTKLTELRALDDQHRVIDMPSPLRPRSVN